MEILRIKPVNKGYFASSKVSIRDIAIKRRAGNAILCTRMNPDGTETEVFLIPESAKSLKVGKTYQAMHSESTRKYGEHFINAVLQFKIRDGVVQVDGFQPGTLAYAELFELQAVAFQLV